MRRILVTAISGDIGNGIVRILRETDCALYGCDINEIAVGMDRVDEFRQSPLAVDPVYISWLLDTCRDWQITHLIPVNEREIEVISPVRHLFEDEGIKIVIQNADLLSICLDKYRTAEFLKKQGLTVPETFLTADGIPADGEKYIVKPRHSNGSKGIRIMTGAALLACPEDQRTEDAVIQQYIDSPDEYTVGVFRTKGILNTIAFKRKLKHGYSSQVELVNDSELVRLAETASGAFDLEGYFNIQLRKLDGKYYIFEINPRISGTVRFRHMLGFSDLLWWLDLLDGKEVPVYCCAYKKALGIRELNEKFLTLE